MNRLCIDCAYHTQARRSGNHICLYNGSDRPTDLVTGEFAVTACKDLREAGEGLCTPQAEWFIHKNSVPYDDIPDFLLQPSPVPYKPETMIEKFFRDLFRNLF